MESDEAAVIGINPFQGDGGPAEVTANATNTSGLCWSRKTSVKSR